MNPNELKRRFKNASQSFIRANQDNKSEGIGSSPKPQCGLGNVPLGKNKDKEANPKRIEIVYSVFRKRFCDPDNIFLKWHTDALRYEGLIKDDRYQDIEISVIQIQSKEEYVEIEIIYP